MKSLKKKKLIDKKGFTLVELLIVMAIIGLLASIVLISLNIAKKKANDAKRLSDLKQIQIALEMYNDENGSYPNQNCSSTDSGWNNLATDLQGYITELPTDPVNNSTYRYWYDGGGDNDNGVYGMMCAFEYSGNFPLVEDGGYYNNVETGAYYEVGLEPVYDMNQGATSWFND